MEYSELIARIVAVIKENGNKEITGDQLQGVLFDIVGNLGSGYQFGGIVTPLSNPGRPDAKMLYLAFEEGEYEHLGGLTLSEGMGIFTFDSAWHLEVIEYTEREYIERAFEERVNKTTAQAEVDLKADELTPAVPPMVTGSARGILGRSAAARFLYRQTSSGSGAAWLRSIHGRTVSYNQLVQNGDFSDGTTGWAGVQGTIAAASNICTFTMTTQNNGARIQRDIPVIAGHKYYVICTYKTSVASHGRIATGANEGVVGSTELLANTKTTLKGVFIAENSATRMYFYCSAVNEMNVADTCQYTDIMVIDLTQAGLDGIITTPAEFEAWQMEQFGHKGYLGYTPGKLVNVNPTGVLTTGRNVWDEEWESGKIGIDSYNLGIPVPDDECVRSKNPIPLNGGGTYYAAMLGIGALRFVYYDANLSAISSPPSGETTNTAFTPPADAAYARFYFRRAADPVYHNEICINISDPTFNGQYVPYNGHTLPLDFTEHFATGMNGVNGIFDEVVSDENGKFKDGGKRFGVVDLGTLTWTADTMSGIRIFKAYVTGGQGAGTTIVPANILTPIYPTVAASALVSKDKQIRGTFVASPNYTLQLGVRDSDYDNATAADFKAAMNGVPLVFELATPQHVTFTDPSDAVYPVTEGGTEQVLPVNGKVPTTISPDMTLQMPRILGKDAPTIGSLDNLVAAVAQKIGRTITKEWDNEIHSYQFEIQ